MMASLKSWFSALSKREQIMVSILGVLMAVIGGYYLVFVPIQNAINGAKEQHSQAVQSYGNIAAKVQQLKESKKQPRVREIRGNDSSALNIYIGQSAGEIGFALEKNAAVGNNRVDIIIAAARSKPLFTWLAKLEEEGIESRSLSVKSQANGTLSVEASLVRGGAL